MKKLFLTTGLLLAASAAIFAQTYMTRTGRILFDATTKSSPERVDAKNNEVACVVDAKTGEVRFQVPIKSFKFEKTLMQEHFNENYLESDKYPKSDFKGTITNLADVHFDKDGTYNAKVSGKLTLHGVTLDINQPGTITVKGNSIKLSAKFPITLKDVNISVPAVVSDKVDKVVKITLDADLVKK